MTRPRRARAPFFGHLHVALGLVDGSAFYRELDVASATRWADVLKAFLGAARAHQGR